MLPVCPYYLKSNMGTQEMYFYGLIITSSNKNISYLMFWFVHFVRKLLKYLNLKVLICRSLLMYFIRQDSYGEKLIEFYLLLLI